MRRLVEIGRDFASICADVWSVSAGPQISAGPYLEALQQP